ncbi:HD domain-containing protein [Clostridium chauvoei]|uniref:HD domain-containing protein n=3 Tax=Clostridium chauvoei TaxID=46867 RepID=A0ABD4RJH7_9CLOT|nr:HD domain-containing protein [Clostridium chauvoei]ATD53756.1 hydrolase [Clostridium chauvoei]ATD56277.1 hydrolase [Clostridium chauvoei]MBX7281448.1 HD domain-containing protein [Clostridium chauvoei]MBX7283994.1 HD domain-containing protein [Clostridium chauvoei]MBX7286496.1 HD domain-containing protein [Clostridium chauvoei]
MSLYRVKQFLWAIESNFKRIDYDYLRKYLNSDEIKLFDTLKHNDKHHCIRVCKDSILMKEQENIDVDDFKLAKAALLHDIGKSKFKLNIFEKSIVVLLDKATNGKINKYDNIKQIDIYYNHPKIGEKILRKYNYDEEFLQVIKQHHNYNYDNNNKILEIISKCDNKN